jgi:hypothetical protein
VPFFTDKVGLSVVNCSSAAGAFNVGAAAVCTGDELPPLEDPDPEFDGCVGAAGWLPQATNRPSRQIYATARSFTRCLLEIADG